MLGHVVALTEQETTLILQALLPAYVEAKRLRDSAEGNEVFARSNQVRDLDELVGRFSVYLGEPIEVTEKCTSPY